MSEARSRSGYPDAPIIAARGGFSGAALAKCKPDRRSSVGEMAKAIALIVMLGACFAFAGWAQEGGRLSSPTLQFHIPQQSLTTALQAYSAASGVAVIFESGVGHGRMSTKVEGEFTREAALKTLLSDSDLIIRYARADAVSLVDPSVPTADLPPAALLGSADMALDTLHVPRPGNNSAERNALADYVGAIQSDIQDALKKTPATRGGSYRVGLNLWVDSSRVIRKTEVFRSTGIPGRDVAISTALQGLVFRQAAPANTPQPVRVMIVISAM